MQLLQLHFIFAFAAALTAGTAVHAHDRKVNSLHIEHPYARATVPHQPSGAAYLTIENKGKDGDRLIAVTSPVAKSVEIHTMSMDGNVMKMREVPAIELKPSARLVMQPGEGYHLMLLGLRRPLKAGDRFPLTLTFEKAGKTEVSVAVEDQKDAEGNGAHHLHH